MKRQPGTMVENEVGESLVGGSLLRRDVPESHSDAWIQHEIGLDVDDHLVDLRRGVVLGVEQPCTRRDVAGDRDLAGVHARTQRPATRRTPSSHRSSRCACVGASSGGVEECGGDGDGRDRGAGSGRSATTRVDGRWLRSWSWRRRRDGRRGELIERERRRRCVGTGHQHPERGDRRLSR